MTESADAAPLGADTSAPRLSRIERRHLAETQAAEDRRSRSLIRTWWVYPLAAALLVSLYFGVQSALSERPDQPTVVTSVPPAP